MSSNDSYNQTKEPESYFDFAQLSILLSYRNPGPIAYNNLYFVRIKNLTSFIILLFHLIFF